MLKKKQVANKLCSMISFCYRFKLDKLKLVEVVQYMCVNHI